MRKLAKLISGFEEARERLNLSIEDFDDQEHDPIIELDRLLDNAFNKIMDADLAYQSEKLDRIHFLLGEIKAISEDSKLVMRLCDAINQDVLSIAYAEPTNAKPVDPDFIRETFIGNSWNWSKGGCVYHEDGRIEAFWDGALVLGKWFIDQKATLYNNAIWFEEQSKEVKSYHFLEYFRHVYDQAGNLWQHEFDEGWTIFDTKSVTSGNCYQSEILSFRKRFGVEDLSVEHLLEVNSIPSIN